MKALFKKYGWIVLLLFVCGGVLSIGYNFLQDLFFERGMAAAREEYQLKIDAADAKAALAEQAKKDLAEKAGKDREKLRLGAEAEIRKINNVFAVFKSETSEELRARQATIESVLAEKEKDEIVIVEAKETILYLGQFFYGTLIAWKISDEAIEAANKSQIEQLNIKYAACADWSAKLEAKLARPKFWTYLKDAAIIGGAFLLGRASK